jgi:hypothetical protein
MMSKPSPSVSYIGAALLAGDAVWANSAPASSSTIHRG